MRGLTAIEWELLESAAPPDSCNEDWMGSDYDDGEAAVADSLAHRGLITAAPCHYDPEDSHSAPTADGRLLPSLGRSIVVCK